MVAGQFKPVSVAIAEQGGGNAGIKAIKDFMDSAVKSGNVSKYIWVQPMTKRLEIAVPTRKWAEGSDLSWVMMHTLTTIHHIKIFVIVIWLSLLLYLCICFKLLFA